MLFSSRNYAIGMAHYQIAGGTRALILLAVGYVLLAGTILGLIVHNCTAAELPDALRGVGIFLLVAESFGLLFFGSGRLASCIRLDTGNNMLESHRLMPISAPRVVLAYIFGTTSQLVALLVLNSLVLAGVLAGANVPMEQFITSQLVLAFFTAFVWSFMAMGAFMFRQALPMMVMAFVFGGMSSAFLRQFGILPAVTILETPFLGETIYGITNGGVNLRGIYYIALPGQIAFAALFFIGACRRYRGSYLTTFNVGMGIALVALWGVLTLLSIDAWPDVLDQFSMRGRQPTVPTQIVAALVAGAILLIVPLHALATWEGAHRLSAIRRWGAVGGVFAAGVLPIFAGDDRPAQFISIAVIALHVLTLYAAFRFTRGMGPLGSGSLIVGLLALLWAGPLLLEVARWILVVQGTGNPAEFSTLSTLSPLGMLMRAWHTVDGMPPIAPGLVFQALVAGTAWAFASQRTRKLARADEPKLLAA